MYCVVCDCVGAVLVLWELPTSTNINYSDDDNELGIIPTSRRTSENHPKQSTNCAVVLCLLFVLLLLVLVMHVVCDIVVCLCGNVCSV